MLFPEIPVGGRLVHFFPKWEEITNDKWVLAIIQNGYKLEFLQKPPFLGVKKTFVNVTNLELLKQEVKNLLEKDAVEIVQKTHIQTGFYSTLFLVEKKNGKLRPVINLRPLNQYLKKQHFKMDTMTKVLNLVKKGDWACSLDLQDAYLHVPIFPKHRKYLRFAIDETVYQFKVLCFGPTSSPRVFTKIVSVVAAHLRKQGIRLAVYLDDWLIVDQQKSVLVKNRDTTITLLTSLGFIINTEKSDLMPTQTITYIGGLFRLDLGLVYPTPERIKNLKITIIQLMKGQISARHYLKVLGLIASCLELIPNSRLFMRPIQMHLLQVWRPSKMSLEYQIPCTQELKAHLAWWLCQANTMKGRSLFQESTSVTITTDASMTGWGGHLGTRTVQGLWSTNQLELLNHINNLELEAVFLTVKHFLPILTNKHVLIRSDNTTVVQYINKQGGTKSIQLCSQTWNLWNMVLTNKIVIKAAHIAGVKNILADQLSRIKVKPTEWSLNKAILNKIFLEWGSPTIDLFASAQNRKCPVFCAWDQDPTALTQDALSIGWDRMFAYAYPPLSLIPKVLQHMIDYQCEMILIAPFWPKQWWYPQLIQLLIAQPLLLPQWENLLEQGQGRLRIFHPNPEIFSLTAWRISTNNLKQKAFQKTLENYCPRHGELVHTKTTNVNLDNSVAGVINGKLIHMLQL